MEVRRTRPSDWLAIDLLIKRARFKPPALWQWEAHLSARGFVVVEIDGEIEGTLLASADDSPVGWVRLAALSDALGVGPWLDLSLPPALSYLRTLHARQVAWMDHGDWAGPFLEKRGFAPRAEVITLTKTDRSAPQIEAPPITLRPVSDADFGALAAIDHEAFTPTWWRSEASMRRRASTASRFTVAQCDAEVIGYAERELHLPTAHLNRIAVHPRYQGQGIGAVLLRHVLVHMWRCGADVVSLNTQRDNYRSLGLYQRFGFQATGDSVTVWTLQL